MNRYLVAAVVSLLGSFAVVQGCVGDASSPGGTSDTDSGADAHPDDREAGVITPGQDAGGEDGAAVDGSAFDAAPTCDPTKPFGTPALVPGIINAAEVDGFWLLPDQLTVFISSSQDTDAGIGGLLFGTRANPAATFTSLTAATSLNGVATGFGLGQPTLTADGNTIYFGNGTGGSYDTWTATRASTAVQFGAPQLVAAPINVGNGGAGEDVVDWVSPDGNTVYLMSNRTGSALRDIWVATRAGVGPFNDPTPLAAVNSATSEQNIILTPDQLQAFVTRGNDIYYTSRPTKAAGFSPPVLLSELSGGRSTANWTSADGCMLYFTSNRGDGGANDYRAYVATRGK